MTRKDYVVLAEAFRWALKGTEDATVQAGVRTALSEVMQALRADDGRFDRDRFLAAVNR